MGQDLVAGAPHAPLAYSAKGEGGKPADTPDTRTTRDTRQASERVLRCRACGAVVAREADVFSMSAEGPVGAFVNPHGYLHEVITVRRAEGVFLVGQPTAAHTWFAGYAWTIAGCLGCSAHLGWLFEAEGDQSPARFWGLRRTALAGA